jgi:hypothetical protein
MLASSTETAVPENPTLTATPVGIVYTFEAGSAVWMKVAVMPPNDSASVQTIACFAVGLIAYTMDAVRVLAIGDAVVRTYVAPDPVVLCVAVIGTATLVVHVNTAVLPTVTIEPPPLATTTHVADVGNVYIDVVGTMQATTVLVDANVNVSVCCTAVAVTVAPRTLVPTNVVASDTGMVGVLATARMLVFAPDKKAPIPMAAFRVLSVLLKVNCVCVALDAMSE